MSNPMPVLNYRSPPPRRRARWRGEPLIVVLATLVMGMAYVFFVIYVDAFVNGKLVGIWSHGGPAYGCANIVAATAWLADSSLPGVNGSVPAGPLLAIWVFILTAGGAGYSVGSMLVAWRRPVLGRYWWRLWVVLATWGAWFPVPRHFTLVVWLD